MPPVAVFVTGALHALLALFCVAALLTFDMPLELVRVAVAFYGWTAVALFSRLESR